jgi:SNF2 family DNA or RNA helicase
MIVHGNFIKHNNKMGFIFWGESVFRSNTKTKTKTVVPLLPGIESIKNLENILNVKGEQIEKIILLPKIYFESERIVNSNDNFEFNELVKYRIKGLFLDRDVVFKLFSLLDNSLEGFINLKLSIELKYWITFFKFTYELIVKQKFFPKILYKDGYIDVNWNIFVELDRDKERMNKFIINNPPVTRAYFDLKDKNYIPVGKKEIIDEFVNYIFQDIFENFKNSDLELDDGEPLMYLMKIFYNMPQKKISKEFYNKILDEYNNWFKPLFEIEKIRQFTTCFKVLSPIAYDGPWEIVFVLQDSEDKSLTFNVKDLWDDKYELSNYLDKNYIDPKEIFIEDLNHAIKIFKPFENCLKNERPYNCLLKDEEVYEFLTFYSNKLKEEGFEILVPQFWDVKEEFNLDIKVKEKKEYLKRNKSDKDLNLDKILEYNWKLSLGDKELTQKEFKKLALLKMPVINIKGKWIHLTKEQIEGFKLLWKERKNKKLKSDKLLKMQLNKENYIPGLNINKIDSDNSNLLEDIKFLSDSKKIQDTKSPEGLNATLRNYQKEGFSWLRYLRDKRIGACLADDMGLGKTIQLITLLLYDKEIKNTKNASLIVCPTSLIGNWKKETEKFAPGLKVAIHHGTSRIKKEKEFFEFVDINDLILTTFSLAYLDEKLISKYRWTGLILDEAQNIKNSFTKQTKAIKKINAEYRIALTGTPVENRLSELWSIVDFLNKGYLGSYKDFNKNYATPIETGKGNKEIEILKNMVSPFILRRLKTDPNIVKNLPDKNEMKIYCNLTKEQASLYEAVISNMLRKVSNKKGIERKGIVLASLSNLKQICNHPIQFLKDNSDIKERSGKVNTLLDMLKKVIIQKDKVLIFTQFSEMGLLLEKVINVRLNVKTMFLHGNINRKKRDEMVKVFQSDDMEYPVFILSLKAGGVGITLTKANHVFHFDRWWNPAVENQATDRAFRLGQKKNVQVYKFVCIGTLEEKIDKLIESKKVLADSVIGSGEEWITEMSDKELNELLKLESKDLILE